MNLWITVLVLFLKIVKESYYDAEEVRKLNIEKTEDDQKLKNAGKTE